MDSNNPTVTKADIAQEIGKNGEIYGTLYADFKRLSKTTGKESAFKICCANIVLSFRQREILIRNGQMPSTPSGIQLLH